MNQTTRGGELRVAIVGCGQIADAHLKEIARVRGARVVAVCDVNGDVAYQAGERFGISARYCDLSTMLKDVSPDVVHLTIPAHVRAAAVASCFAAGAHVYVEKPVALDEAELAHLYALAARHGRLLCPGHDQLFDPAWTEVRQLAASGVIGEVIHVDALQGYDLAGPFGQRLQSDSRHWVRSLPGGLFQNVISHALARICDLLPNDFATVSATWQVRRGHQDALPSELRVLCCSKDATASLVFTSAVKPVQRVTTIRGSRATLHVDLDSRMVRVERASSCPAAMLKLYLPATHLRDAGQAVWRNLVAARAGRLRYFAGMGTLFDAFYDAIRGVRDNPINQVEAMRVTRLMDRIIDDCRERELADTPKSILGATSRSTMVAV